MPGFLSPLMLQFVDGTSWTITEPFSYAVGRPTGDVVINIPAGFVTDFASVPQALWSLLPPTGWYGKAAVVHDWLYQKAPIVNGNLKSISRKFADDTLAEAMRVLAADRLVKFGSIHGELYDILKRTLIYLGIRAFGWIAWNKYRRNDINIAKAILSASLKQDQ